MIKHKVIFIILVLAFTLAQASRMFPSETGYNSALRPRAAGERIADAYDYDIGGFEPPREGSLTTIFFDVGNVILSFDYHIAAREIARRCGARKEDIYELLEGSRYKQQLQVPFETGKFTPHEYFTRFAAILKRDFDIDLTMDMGTFFSIFNSIFRYKYRAAEVIRRLKMAGYRVFFISNVNPVHKAYWLNIHNDIFRMTDGFIASCEVGVMKDDPRIFDEALKVAGLSLRPDKAVFLDDIGSYVEVAASRGVNAFQVTPATDIYQALRDILRGDSRLGIDQTTRTSAQGATPQDETGRIPPDRMAPESKAFKSKFDEYGFVSTAIIPDGKGGYFEDTLGFPGSWQIENKSGEYIESGAMLRTSKSLQKTLENLTYRGVPNLTNGKIIIIGKRTRIISSIVRTPKGFECRIQVPRDFLYQNPSFQREALRISLQKAKIVEEPGPSVESLAAQKIKASKDLPRVVFIPLGSSGIYGAELLNSELEESGIPSAVRDFPFRGCALNLADRYIEELDFLPEFGDRAPSDFCVSILDDDIELAVWVIARIRERFPEAWIWVGGPSTATCEQLASVIEDFDVMIKGEADEMLPELLRLKGGRPRHVGFNERELREITKRYQGGIFIKQRGSSLIHNIAFTCHPAEFHIAKPIGKGMVYHWLTSRGCNRNCAFCLKWGGIRYRMAMPWNETEEEKRQTIEKRSARAMVEFLLQRLANEFGGRVEIREIEAQLAAHAARGRRLKFPGIKDKINIIIRDDDVLINKRRIREFRNEMFRLGLQHYFEFVVITNGLNLDEDMLDSLRDIGVKNINVGTDGLTQAIIDQNRKGIDLEKVVFPLNAECAKRGISLIQNIIWSTPLTTRRQLVEAMICYCVLPFRFNSRGATSISGYIGSDFTNEYIRRNAHKFQWGNLNETANGYYVIQDGFRIPRLFTEYAMRVYAVKLAPEDSDTAKLLEKMGSSEEEEAKILQVIFEVLEHADRKELDAIIGGWCALPDENSEMKALGNVVRFLTAVKGLTLKEALVKIKDEMGMARVYSFRDYFRLLTTDGLKDNKDFIWIKAKVDAYKGYVEKGRFKEAEVELRDVIAKRPDFVYAYYWLAELMVLQRRYSDYFKLTRNVFNIENIPWLSMPLFYKAFISSGLRETIADCLQVPTSIRELHSGASRFFYAISKLRELVEPMGVKKVRFKMDKPSSIRPFNLAIDRLTPMVVDETLATSKIDITAALVEGKKVFLFGIPVSLSEGGKTLFFDFDNIVQRDEALDVIERNGKSAAEAKGAESVSQSGTSSASQRELSPSKTGSVYKRAGSEIKRGALLEESQI